MWNKTPNKYLFACGSGEGNTPLTAFDSALYAAGIGHYNLVKVTSIIPPSAVRQASIDLPLGTVVPAAFASIHSVTPEETITAAVSVARPVDSSMVGLIMEYSARGHKKEIEEIVRNMAEEGMAMRGSKIKSLDCQSVEHRVRRIGCVIAAVLLW